MIHPPAVGGTNPAEDRPPLTLRTATLADLDVVTALEALCFPPSEAASREAFRNRLTVYPGHFHLLFLGDRLISMVNGMPTTEPDLRDEMYSDATLCDESGDWLMIFGVATDPAFRKRGYAGLLIDQAIERTRSDGRAGLVLTCKPEKIAYYARFGFADEGVSPSEHGGVLWHQMRLRV